MFWPIVFFLTASQISHVISYCDTKSNSSSCATVYSKLENLCYDFTGKAGDYFSVQDIHQRDGFFAVREASLYVGYNECGRITRSIDNYRTGQDLEKNKVTPGGGNSPQGGGSSTTPNSNPNSSSLTSSSPPTSTTPSTSSSNPANPNGSPSSIPSPSSTPSGPSSSGPSTTPAGGTPP